MLTSEKLVAYQQLINVIGRGGFGRVLASTRKVDNLSVRSYFYLAKESLSWLENILNRS